MNRILLIGNSGSRSHSEDGQTVKVRLYRKKIIDEGFDLDFIELENFVKTPFSVLRKIKNGIKNCDRIVLISAKRGCKLLIPYINKINRKYNKEFVLPLIGISVLHYSTDTLTNEEKNLFFIEKKYSLCKQNERFCKQLSKISYILPETDVLVDAFKGFYGLNNVVKLNNFREFLCADKIPTKADNLIKLVFISRVTEIKGIFDLLDVVKTLSITNNISLDIYGLKRLTKKENELFDSCLDGATIKYGGIIPNGLVYSTIVEYDLLVFPTRYFGEGTPGIIAESLIAGVPVLTTDFPQARFLLKDGFDSVFCKMFDKNDLKEKLQYIINSNGVLTHLKKGAIESGKKYTYDYEKKTFLRYICGVEEE